MLRKLSNAIVSFIFLGCTSLHLHAVIPEKIIICGVCKDVEKYLDNDFKHIQMLGAYFQDYRVIIYENNSTDNTKAKLLNWAGSSFRHIVISEDLTPSQLLEGVRCFSYQGRASRMELIAKARNRILDLIKTSQFTDYKYVVMIDLDFASSWPIEEIVKTVSSKKYDWDCVSANGVDESGAYYDRYALRDAQFPFGPELLSEVWWNEIVNRKIALSGKKWIPVYSAFGGLAIYKRASILCSAYSGSVTDDLKVIYKNILEAYPRAHPQIQAYRSYLAAQGQYVEGALPVIFRHNSGYYDFPVCCEHVTFHASMSLQGFGKIYVNPNLFLRY